MPLQVWTPSVNPRHTYSYRDERPAVVAPFIGGGRQASSRASRAVRTWPLEFRFTAAQRLTEEAFLRAHGFGATSFLYKDLKDFARTGELVTLTLVSGDTYALPDTGEYGGDYPIDNANLQMYDDGVEAAHASVDTDARTITLSATPGGVVTADYDYYRRVVQAEPVDWGEPVYGYWFPVRIALAEVLIA